MKGQKALQLPISKSLFRERLDLKGGVRQKKRGLKVHKGNVPTTTILLG